MRTAEEALDWMISSVQEWITEAGNPGNEDTDRLNHAVELIRQELTTPREDELVDTIKSVMKLIEDGANYYAGLHERFGVRIRISADLKDQSMTAIAMSETAGAVSALGSLLGHLMSEEATKRHRINEIFTGKGLTYPKVNNRGQSTLILPKK